MLAFLIFNLTCLPLIATFVPVNVYADEAYDDMISASDEDTSSVPQQNTTKAEYKNTGSWLGDNRDGIYDIKPDEDYTKRQPSENSEGFLIRNIGDLIYEIGYGINGVLSSIGANLDNLLFGRLSTHRQINLFMFELTKGNPYGFVATIIYNIFAKVVFIALIAVTMFKLAAASWGGSTPQKRAEVKGMLKSVVFMAVLVYLMPFLYDIVEYIRDVFLMLMQGIIDSLGGSSGGFMNQLDADAYGGDLIGKIMYTASACLAVYMAFEYIDLTLSMMLYFIAFPIIAALSIKDKHRLETWVYTVFAAFMTPILDVALFMVPMILVKFSRNMPEGAKAAYLIVNFIICSCICGARKHFQRMLDLHNDSNFGGALRSLAAAKALTGSVKKLAGTAAGFAAGAGGAIMGGIGNIRKNHELKNLDKKYAGENIEDEATTKASSETQRADMLNADDIASKGAGRKENSDYATDDKTNTYGTENDFEGNDAEGAFGSMAYNSETEGTSNVEKPTSPYNKKNAVTANKGSDSAEKDPDMPKAYNMDGMNEYDAKVNDAMEVAKQQESIRDMNSEIYKLNSANKDLELEKSSLETSKQNDVAAVGAYRSKIQNINAENRTLSEANRQYQSVISDASSSPEAVAKAKQAMAKNNEKIRQNNIDIQTNTMAMSEAQQRVSEADIRINSVQSKIAANNSQRAAYKDQIDIAHDNINSIRSNADVRRAQLEATKTAKAMERQKIIDKFANISNMDSPEFRDISPERRAQLERRRNVQRAVVSGFRISGGIVGGTVGAVATTFGSMTSKAVGVATGMSVGGAVAGGAAEIGAKVVSLGAGTVQTGAFVKDVVKEKRMSRKPSGSTTINLDTTNRVTQPLPTANMHTPTFKTQVVKSASVNQGNYAQMQQAMTDFANFKKGTYTGENVTISSHVKTVFDANGIKMTDFKEDKKGLYRQVDHVMRSAGYTDTATIDAVYRNLCKEISKRK